MTRSDPPDPSLEPTLDPVPLEPWAYALSTVLALFAAWAWLYTGQVWEAFATGDASLLTPMTPGYVVLALLSFVVQMASNVAAAAARQAKAFNAESDFTRAVTLLILGGGYNALSLHHALGVVGFLGPDVYSQATAIAVALVLAFYEPGQYWVDASLKVEISKRRALSDRALRAEQDQRDANWRSHDIERRRVDASREPARRESLLETGLKAVAAGAPAVVPGAALAQDGPPSLSAPRAEIAARAHAGDEARVAQAVALRDRFRREVGDGWRMLVAKEMNVSERTVTRYLARAAQSNARALETPAPLFEVAA